MVLEATVVCLDNSEWMRNGDFAPNRLEAQIDAVNMVCGAKMQGNPENTVGILTMAKRPDVLVSLTQDVGKILTCLHELKIEGRANLLTSLQIAKLCLKHRQNKYQKQRVVAFIGSPIEEDEAQLVKVAKLLRKSNVSVDIINFGDMDSINGKKLEAFINAVNKDGTSHLINVPLTETVLTDIIVTSSLLGEDHAGSLNEFGVDPNMDPDLAMVLRISAQEEEERQRRLALEASGGMGESQQGQQVGESMTVVNNTDAQFMHQDVAMTEEEELQLALQMSLADNVERANNMNIATDNSNQDPDAMQVENQDFLADVLNNLPGVRDEEDDKSGDKK